MRNDIFGHYKLSFLVQKLSSSQGGSLREVPLYYLNTNKDCIVSSCIVLNRECLDSSHL